MDQNYTIVPTKVYYLKMHKTPNFKPIEISNSVFSILQPPIATKEYLYYYRKVGEIYNWHDRLFITDLELYNLINAPKTEIFIYFIDQNAAGFAEFIREKAYTEILYFGLFPNYIGKGYGKSFLQEVIHQAWKNKPKWIQLNTCELDHPNALPTYYKSGFELDKTTIENRKIIEQKKE